MSRARWTAHSSFCSSDAITPRARHRNAWMLCPQGPTRDRDLSKPPDQLRELTVVVDLVVGIR
jgi:hypothetical protein